jgi:hypothetical protein
VTVASTRHSRSDLSIRMTCVVRVSIVRTCDVMRIMVDSACAEVYMCLSRSLLPTRANLQLSTYLRSLSCRVIRSDGEDSGRCWYLDRASSVYAMNARQTPTARARPQKAGSNQGYGTEDNDHYGYISGRTGRHCDKL